MVNLRLIREPVGIERTFGVLFIDGYFQCHTLENSKKIIPAGDYGLTFYPSPKNKIVVPMLVDVIGRSYIQIHPANYSFELEGCIAPGLSRSNDMVLQSRVAFNAIMDKIRDTKCKIRIEEWA